MFVTCPPKKHHNKQLETPFFWATEGDGEKKAKTLGNPDKCMTEWQSANTSHLQPNIPHLSLNVSWKSGLPHVRMFFWKCISQTDWLNQGSLEGRLPSQNPETALCFLPTKRRFGLIICLASVLEKPTCSKSANSAGSWHFFQLQLRSFQHAGPAFQREHFIRKSLVPVFLCHKFWGR